MRETWTAAIIGHSNFQLWRPDWVQAHPYVLIFTELRLRRVSDDVQVASIRLAGNLSVCVARIVCKPTTLCGVLL